MTRTSDLAHPETPYQIRPYDPNPTLPPGHGAIAMRVWCPRASVRFTTAPVVTVDGRPAVYGWGHALIVVPVGPHVVAVPKREASFTVAPGAVVPLECAASYDATAPASLGPPGQLPAGRPPVGVPVLAALALGMLAAVAVLMVMLYAEIGTLGLVVAAAVGTTVGAFVFAATRRRGTQPSS